MPLPSYAAFDEKDLGAQVLLSQYKLRTSGDAVTVRQDVARYMKEHGATALSVTRFATAVSEIARNAIVHAGGGEFSIYVDPRAKQLTVVCWDKGPGIEDVELALTDGYTSGGGLGRGLGGAKRLAKIFEIRTAIGRGTSVLMSVNL
ncbi:MAG TPA: ATP-binding protein [Sulfitobacter sp.]|nr:ATP-binding protein [Sulfitobacter sp.]HBB84319.1 ATP-binding protein [Sulfitobacter sp.]